MTKIEEISQRINEIGESFIESLNECQNALAELKESKKEGKWKPTYNEMYIYRADFGGIRSCYWADSEIDEWRYNNLPIFKTTDECKRYWHFMDTVKEKSYEFSKEEWINCDIPKYVIKYLGYTNEFKTGCFDGVRYLGTIYFKDEESAQYIIDNFKDELMEYWI